MKEFANCKRKSFNVTKNNSCNPYEKEIVVVANESKCDKDEMKKKKPIITVEIN